MADTCFGAELRLVNGSTGDPALFIDEAGRDNALLFDAGDNSALSLERLGDLEAVFVTHHHVDHFIGLDRIVRANLDRDKVLHVFGPQETIRRVYDRVKSYEYPFFEFQKMTLSLHEILPGRRRSALLECSKHFREPEVDETAWNGEPLFETEASRVEGAFVDHTVPCLAFALAVKPALKPDPEKLAAGPLRPGPWVREVQKLARANAPGDTSVSAGAERHPLGMLVDNYFVETPGHRITYVTDTTWSDASRPALLALAEGAHRLYCDSFYAQAQLGQAEKYRHMTAPQAAELATLAGVEELVLIHFASRYRGRYELLLDEARAIFPRASAEF